MTAEAAAPFPPEDGFAAVLFPAVEQAASEQITRQVTRSRTARGRGMAHLSDRAPAPGTARGPPL
ncbi:hypothetical protein GCM10017559_30010 [Streptosporangium longisporum]|uniref:Uncharacterized protein n=1 Tax=Streptosporangium longisporum TaxID=46187 RepID=A0ABN3Y0W0_9ACTN